MAFPYRPRESAQPAPAPQEPPGIYADFRAWCRDRSALLRLPVLIYFAYVGYRQFCEPLEYNSLFFGINLAIHEGGHLLMRPLGNDLLHVAGGTALQLAAPLICLILLLRQREFFGLPFCLGWLSTNFISVGNYMADARAQEMPLVSAEGGDGPTIHDWNWLFTYFGLLDEDTAIGLATRAIGTATMLAALLAGAWMLFAIVRANRNKTSS